MSSGLLTTRPILARTGSRLSETAGWLSSPRAAGRFVRTLPFLVELRRMPPIWSGLEVDVKAKELLEANQLSAAILELNEEVKQHPTDPRIRTFLFELLCFDGAYDRAERQLDILGSQDDKAEIGIEVYRNLLKADAARRRFFTGGTGPTFLASPPEYVRECLAAVLLLHEGNPQGAKGLIAKSQASAPRLSGTINGRAFAGISDSDDRICPALELFSNGAYMWLPFQRIKMISLRRPNFLRDLLWVPAHVECLDGQQGEVYLPTLYPRSESDENQQVRLGRITEWVNLGEGLVGGLGLKTFVIGDVETSLLEINELKIE
jgi:type VI secretion system protein ImpE